MEPTATTDETGSDVAEEGTTKNKGFGFVHYALEEDAQKALDSLKTVKFQGRRLKGEFAMKKHVKFDHTILAKELPKIHKARPVEKPKRIQSSDRVEIKFAKPGDFNKKQLYKKVRKVGNLKELEYPWEGDESRALAIFHSADDTQKAMKKLDKHVFKGVKMTASLSTSSFTSNGGNTVKAHRLIVRNLPFTIQPHVLDQQFGSFGKILEIVLPTKPGSTVLKGFAFVQFDTKEAAVLAMAALNGKEVEGRPVAVDWAVGKNLYEQIIQSEKDDNRDADKESNDDMDVDVEGISEDDDPEDDGNGEDEEVNIMDSDSGDESEKTVFVRNISFETNESALSKKFKEMFGELEYCKLVKNPQTGLSKGTAFIKFKTRESAQQAISVSQQLSQDQVTEDSTSTLTEEELAELKRKRAGKNFKSILVDEEDESTSQTGILLDGRALSLVPAVDRDEAKKLKLVDEGENKDKRRLKLISESLANPVSSVAKKFWTQQETAIRASLVKARLAGLKKNPNSIVSNVRLSIRHLPVALDEPQLRAVLEHVLEESLKHASSALSDYPVYSENAVKAKPRIKQVKIVRSTGEERESRAGRSKGFGFVELAQPSHALLLLRYATNHIPDVWNRMLPEIFGRRVKESAKTSDTKPMIPVIEFAIDKTAVLDRTGKAQTTGKQVHRKKPTPPKHTKYNK